MQEPAPAITDNKDWAWSAQRPCPDCGYDPLAITGDAVGAALRETSARWRRVLGRGDVRARPRPQVWSPLEYGCHVRDVHGLFSQRVSLMLAQNDPAFASWDQNSVAVAERYWAQNPALVAEQLATAGDAAAARYEAVPADAWSRTGRRADGSVFTVLSIGRYHLHDVMHHLSDVQG